MTTDLEKQFFDTFGIEPYYKYLLIDKTTRYHNEKLLDKTNFIDFVKSEKDYLLLKVVKHYPQITDRHYLEFVRICCNECPWEFPSDFKNVEELKRFLIYNITQLEYIDRVKQQIIELFKE